MHPSRAVVHSVYRRPCRYLCLPPDPIQSFGGSFGMHSYTARDGGKKDRHRLLQSVLTAALLLFTLSAAGAKVIYVKTTGLDTNSGLSWALAKATVPAAMTTARAGDEVWVAAGTYVQRVTVKAGVSLYGGFA